MTQYHRRGRALQFLSLQNVGVKIYNVSNQRVQTSSKHQQLTTNTALFILFYQRSSSSLPALGYGQKFGTLKKLRMVDFRAPKKISEPGCHVVMWVHEQAGGIHRDRLTKGQLHFNQRLWNLGGNQSQ